MLNRVIIMGRITVDIELQHSKGGVATASFSVAVDRKYTDGDGVRKTDFIKVVAWRQTAVFVEKYFSKGKMIAIEGSIQTRNYEDKQGNKRTAFEVLAEQVYFADAKAKDTTATEESEEQSGQFDPRDFEDVDTDDSEVPF